MIYRTLLTIFLIIYPTLSYADTTTGLVGHWKLDEVSGTTAYDSSGNGNNGTLQNTPTWTSGRIGGALVFNGTSSQYVDTPSFTLPSNISFCAWTNPQNIPNNYKFFIGSDNAATGGGADGIVIANDPTNKFYVAIKNGYMGQTSASAFSTGTWYQICGVGATANGNTPSMYINGVLQSGTNGSISTGTSGGHFYIGGTPRAGFYSTAIVDDVRIYNRVLSAADVAQLYNIGKFVFKKGKLGKLKVSF